LESANFDIFGDKIYNFIFGGYNNQTKP